MTQEVDGLFHRIIRLMFERTDVPILLNTSFNLQSEPIVETPEDVLWMLLFSGIDACLLSGTLVRKSSNACSPLELTVVPDAARYSPASCQCGIITSMLKRFAVDIRT